MSAGERLVRVLTTLGVPEEADPDGSAAVDAAERVCAALRALPYDVVPGGLRGRPRCTTCSAASRSRGGVR